MAQPPTAPAAPLAGTDRPPASPADMQRLLNRDLRMLADYHACVDEATSNALAQVKRSHT